MTPKYCDSETPVQGTPERPYNYYTVTLTAHWNPKKVTVDYDLGKGYERGATKPPYGTASLGNTFKFPVAPIAASNQLFTGWKITSGKSSETLHSHGEEYLFNDWGLVSSDEELVVTAQYEEKKEKTITFNTNGGTAISPITAATGAIIMIPREVNSVTKEGSIFEGRFTDTTLTTPVEIDVSGVWQWPNTMPAEDKTYYVKWSLRPYTIHFNTNCDDPDSEITGLHFGENITQQVSAYKKGGSSAPTKEHFTFEGWNPALPDTMPSHDLTVDAIWMQTKYSITFEKMENDQETISGLFDSLVIPQDPTEDGLTFVGWKYFESGDVTRDVSFPLYMPDNNPTIVAQWKPSVSVQNESIFGKEDGEIGNLTNNMQYVVNGGTEWQNVTETTLTNLPAGEYKFRFMPNSGKYYSTEVTVVTLKSGNPLNVTFDSEGGTTVAAQSIAYEGKITKPANPYLEGYLFKEWVEKGQSTAWNFESRIEESKELVATWVEIKDPTINEGSPQAAIWDFGKTVDAANSTLSVTAESPDHGELKYQWYRVKETDEIYDEPIKMPQAIPTQSHPAIIHRQAHINTTAKYLMYILKAPRSYNRGDLPQLLIKLLHQSTRSLKLRH